LSKIKSRNLKQKAKEEIAEYLEDTILDYVSRGQSPVAGETAFRPLSKSYIKVKKKISGSSKPNMELYGDMLDDFSTKIDGNSISFGFHKGQASEESLLKAENHNKFTKRSMATKVPKRRFIPTSKGKLKKEIMDDINEIIESYEGENAS